MKHQSTSALILIACLLPACGAGDEGPDLFDDTSTEYVSDGGQLGSVEQALEPIGNCSCRQRYHLRFNCVEREGLLIGQSTVISRRWSDNAELSSPFQHTVLDPESMPTGDCQGIHPIPFGYGLPTSSGGAYAEQQGVPLTCWRTGLVERRCAFTPDPFPLPHSDLL
jgi:hypothetical protein